MSDVASLIADMVRAGVDPDLIGRTAAALSRREPVKIMDEQAERRRAKDRERKRLRNSAESADEVSPKKETSPTPPKEKTTPSSSEDKSSSITPRAALETVLDAERAAAVLEHRKRIGKPLTAHAAKLIAAKLAQWPDPNFAADEMISNGWQGFKPEWLERRTAPQNQSTAPPKKPTLASMWTEEAKALGIIDEPASQQDRRLGASLPGGHDQGADFARRIASA
ncbi:MAG: hypothetical protein ACTHKQ_00950 [Mesorhizobium sp.]